MQRIFNKYYLLAGLLPVLLFGIGCGREKIKPVVITDYYDRIRFIIENNADYDGYMNYLKVANLADTLASPGPYTVFVSNVYITNLVGGVGVDPAQVPMIGPLMHYQLMTGVRRLDTLPLQMNQPIRTTLGKDVYVSRYAIPDPVGGTDTITTVNGTQVTTGNVKASNGMIHVLEHLVAPPGASSLYDMLLSQQDLRFMAVIVDRLNMKSLLQDKGPYTFLAPVNSAFTSDPALAGLGINTVDDIYAVDTVVLGNLVRTHLLKGMMFKKDFLWQYLANGKDHYTAMSGETITISDPSEYGVGFSAPGNTTPAQLSFFPDYATPQEGYITGNGVLIMLPNALIP